MYTDPVQEAMQWRDLNAMCTGSKGREKTIEVAECRKNTGLGN